LQLGHPDNGDDEMVTQREGPAHVAGFESAIDALSDEGIIDRDRVGLVGFSRTVYYVIEALTTSRIHFGAATISGGGVNLSYWGYLMNADLSEPEGNRMIGAAPFGKGLQQSLEKSPEFNLDKVTAPIRIEGHGRPSILPMWEPCAGLRYLHKPVDL